MPNETLDERVRNRVRELRDYYLQNQDLIRAPLFRRFCNPVRWETEWRDLYRIIEEFEKHDGELGNRLIKVEGYNYQRLPWKPFLQQYEKTALEKLISKRCNSHERQIITNDIKDEMQRRVNRIPKSRRTATIVQKAGQRGEEDGLLTAFSVEYRGEYNLALNEADRLWHKSGIEYFVEFAIIECGIIDVDAIKREEIRPHKPKLSSWGM
ncbi:MAG TPA: hypothetical protein PKE69_04535 [Pyrinomonadaceae bacterium]|nr:hypothetical protein [Pyrinomonadaceae bacterium]